jgi:hypothetical protein
LRGVEETKEIFGLRLSQTAALQRVEADEIIVRPERADRTS